MAQKQNVEMGIMPAMCECDECGEAWVCDCLTGGNCPDCRGADGETP